MNIYISNIQPKNSKLIKYNFSKLSQYLNCKSDEKSKENAICKVTEFLLNVSGFDKKNIFIIILLFKNERSGVLHINSILSKDIRELLLNSIQGCLIEDKNQSSSCFPINCMASQDMQELLLNSLYKKLTQIDANNKSESIDINDLYNSFNIIMKKDSSLFAQNIPKSLEDIFYYNPHALIGIYRTIENVIEKNNRDNDNQIAYNLDDFINRPDTLSDNRRFKRFNETKYIPPNILNEFKELLNKFLPNYNQIK